MPVQTSGKLGSIANAETLSYFNLLAILNSFLEKKEEVTRYGVGLTSSDPIPCSSKTKQQQQIS